jgi:hypothetical protein
MSNSNEHNEYFDPDSFGPEEYEHWYQSSSSIILFDGPPAALKRLRSRISHYGSGSVTVQTLNRNQLKVIKK